MNCTLIANSGIQTHILSLSINTQEKYKLWFHEWYDKENSQWRLDAVHELRLDDMSAYYDKQVLYKEGFLADKNNELDPQYLKGEGITPLRVDDEMCEGVSGEVFSMTFSDKDNCLKCFENKWLPLPYFFKRTEKKFKFCPLNWARCKLVPKSEIKGIITYDVILAFDTRTKYEEDDYKECPVFVDSFSTEMNFGLCNDEFALMDFCSPAKKWSYIDEYLFKLVHPEIQNVSQLRGDRIRRMSYIASYVFLIQYIASNNLFPLIKLFKDKDVEVKNVDMVVDIGNSKTTALLIEDNSNFNQVRMLDLVDYTNTLHPDSDEITIRTYSEPFDMRLAFRKVAFGSFGIKGSRQFVYPSLVRLGTEANHLIHKALSNDDGLEQLSTYSSPKRYLWDWKPNKEEWRFLVLPGEADDHILEVPGISNQLNRDGSLVKDGNGGQSFHYSRRSLMTFAFLEMLVQAKVQINSEKHRSNKNGFGYPNIPRKIKRIVVTCPTGMSKLEREALIKCAQDAIVLFENFDNTNSVPINKPQHIEVVPSIVKNDKECVWYYDEATCSQLVYMYGEVGHKYKGFCNEFFDLYGKKENGDSQPSLTVGSLDIGAGTSDLMICKYTYDKGYNTTIIPDPKFYDSYYFAGDDMVQALVKNIMFFNESTSAFAKAFSNLSPKEYRQKIKNFFGPDYGGQTLSDRILRRDFNIQFSVPMMYHYLSLLSNGAKDCEVHYEDVFSDCPPNDIVIEGFKERFGLDITKLVWTYKKDAVSEVVEKEFEPLLKRISTIMFAHSCDVILLSGRPASLPVIRQLFLKYYPVAPNRLIVLNNYYVGDWYPFCKNTGHITNAKTIVAMGGVIGYYASELPNLNNFSLDLKKMKEKLHSTVNYVYPSDRTTEQKAVITPETSKGDIQINFIPATLDVTQIDMKTYPSRPLYCLDFNRYKIADRMRKKAFMNGEEISDSKITYLVQEYIEQLKRKMPLKVSLEKDMENKELLTITAITDKDGNDITDSNLEINIQSLGVNENYWLDSGAFDF